MPQPPLKVDVTEASMKTLKSAPLRKVALAIAHDLEALASEIGALRSDVWASDMGKTAVRVPKKGDFVFKTTTFRAPEYEESTNYLYVVDKVEGGIAHLSSEEGDLAKAYVEDFGPNNKWQFKEPGKYDVPMIEESYSQLESLVKEMKPKLTKMLRLSAQVLGLRSSHISEEWESYHSIPFGEEYGNKTQIWKGQIRVKKSATLNFSLRLSTMIFDRGYTGVRAELTNSANAPPAVKSFMHRNFHAHPNPYPWVKDQILNNIAKFPSRLEEAKDQLGLLSNAEFTLRLAKAILSMVKESEKVLKGDARITYYPNPWQGIGPEGGSIFMKIEVPEWKGSTVQWKSGKLPEPILKTMEAFAARTSERYGFSVTADSWGGFVVKVPAGWPASSHSN
jgi:hypothetical protein